jgi:hypothetical protein
MRSDNHSATVPLNVPAALALLLACLLGCAGTNGIEERARLAPLTLETFQPLEPPARRLPEPQGPSPGGGGLSPGAAEAESARAVPQNAGELSPVTPQAAVSPPLEEAALEEETAAATEARVVSPAAIGETGAPPRPALDFRLVDVTVASEIRGPGDFRPRETRRFNAGESVLVYGEFAGFSEEAEPGDLRLRSFSGSLQLVRPDGTEVDSADFLPVESGVSQAQGAAEFINFWARYTLPPELPAGRYELHVRGRDILADREARAVVAVYVLEAAPPPESRSRADEGKRRAVPKSGSPVTAPRTAPKKSTADSP